MSNFEDEFECDKFDECGGCKNRFKERICNSCGVGEDFEEEDMEEVDAHFGGRI
jgi:hypothetical protein